MSIDLSVFIWTIINFVVLMVLLNFILFKPIHKILDERKERINSGLAAGEEARAAKLANDKRLQEEVDANRANARKLLENAKNKADAEQTAMLRNAQVEAAAIRKANIAKISEEEKLAVKQIDGQMDSLVSILTGSLLEDKSCAQKNKKAIEKCVSALTANT